jgi:hypothetical protein
MMIYKFLFTDYKIAIERKKCERNTGIDSLASHTEVPGSCSGIAVLSMCILSTGGSYADDYTPWLAIR